LSVQAQDDKLVRYIGATQFSYSLRCVNF